jgi:hypothetical protein
MGKQCRDVYNFSPSFAYFVPNYAANMLKKSYSKDTFDLEQLSLHNGIEHDASLTRKLSVRIFGTPEHNRRYDNRSRLCV